MNLVVVSNRLPFAVARNEGGSWTLEPGSGGLVRALRPVLQNRGGRWIGWTGATQEDLPDAGELLGGSEREFGYRLIPVALTTAEVEGFYNGFSNEIVWPLFHDMIDVCNFDPSYWATYEAVNQRFADVTAENTRPGDFIWVHDYHLMRLGGALRERRLTNRIALFLHIPFPPLDMFLKLPWRFQVLRSLLQYDLIGFQTVRDRRNFTQCLRLLLREARIEGKGAVWKVEGFGRTVRVGAFPISIDIREFEQLSARPEVREKIRSLREDESGRKIILGVDRLDYTKGIPQKLKAFRNLLTRFPEHRGKVTLFQVVVPSREDVSSYRDHKVALERLVGQINGQFTTSGWVPIHYLYRTLEGPRLPAYYGAADIALVTPLKDGMNLVAKEYCASRVDDDGVLVLSEFAGAAAQLQRGAFLVNPFDEDGVADALHAAIGLPAEDRAFRMRRLRRAIRESDIYRWLDTFLEAAVARELADFPRVEDYLPESVIR